MSKLIVLRRCATIEEAFVVDSLLQDGGFLSSTPVRYHAQNDWFSVHAFNGVPVFIPEIEALGAAEYLIEMRATAKERLEDEFGEIDPAPWKRRPIRRWSFWAQQSGLFPLLWLPLAWVLSHIPLPWLSALSSKQVEAAFWGHEVVITPQWRQYFSFTEDNWDHYLRIHSIGFVLTCLWFGFLFLTFHLYIKKTNRRDKGRHL